MCVGVCVCKGGVYSTHNQRPVMYNINTNAIIQLDVCYGGRADVGVWKVDGLRSYEIITIAKP